RLRRGLQRAPRKTRRQPGMAAPQGTSEFELQRYLHLARVAEGVDAAVWVLQRTGGTEVRIRYVADCRIDGAPVGVIEHVVKVGANDQARALHEAKALRQREIQVPQAGLADHHARGRAETRRAHYLERIRIEETRFGSVSSGQVGIGDQIRAVEARPGIGTP